MSLPTFTGMYVFGDSLVDPGNALKLAQTYDDLPFASLPDGAPTAEQGYYKGRFSDGYTYADLISNKIFWVPTKPVFPFGFEDPWLGISYPFASDPSGNNLNFAYGGAQIRKGSESVPDLDDQTDSFDDAIDGDPDPNALHLFTIGGNDVRELVPANGAIVDPYNARLILQRAANELIEEVREVIQDGARHVVVTGIPDVGTIPYYNGLADEGVRRQAATDYSQMLDNMIREQLSQLPTAGIDFHYISFTQATQEIVADLVAAGLYNPAVPLNQSALFFDEVHPSSQAHALLAAAMLDTIGGTLAGDLAPLKNPDYAFRDTIGAPGEIDRLVFSLAASTTYSMEMLGISSGKVAGLASWEVLADPTIRIIGPSGSVVAFNDDGGLGLDAHLGFTTSQAGSYTIELAGVGSLTGSYLMQAENQTVRDDSYYVTSSATRPIEGAGGGNDQVYSSVSYALAGGLSIETLSTNNERGKTSIALTGNELGQTLIGDAGKNVLDGKGGNDGLWGKVGTDTFAFTTSLGSGNVDTIYDYNAKDDTIRLDDAVFAGLAPGPLSAAAFRAGPVALDRDDRIIFDPVSHALSFDLDGNGAGLAVQFATLFGSNLNLTAGDFVVI